MAPVSKLNPKQRARAVRMVIEAMPDYPSEWPAIRAVAEKIGVSAETLRKWVRRAEMTAGNGLD